MKLPKTVLYYGKNEPLPEQKTLRAGPLSLIYEAGDLRYIKLGNHEILRRVYAAIRDHNWGTVPSVLSNVQMDIDEDAFRISYDVENKQSDINFIWHGTITGEANGTVKLTMAGQARSTFRRNRIGFCVLHPMACAGVPTKIEHMDGSVEECSFPQAIAPQLLKDGHPRPVAPFENMRAMSHQVGPNLWAEVRFEGDIFELEDQRNWTDASYKTYGTPLSLPFPVEVKDGTKISQSIQLTLRGDIPKGSDEAGSRRLTFSIGTGTSKSMPQIGLGVASHGQSLTEKAIDRLKALHLSHLRVDLPLSTSTYKVKLRQATTEARSLNIPLEIALFLTDAAQEELVDLANVLQEVQPPVLHWLIFHHHEKITTAQWLNLARQHLATYDASAKIGAGTNIYFTELNAKHPPIEALDVVAYSINPQVHAFDNASLAETFEAQAATVESARQIVGDRPLVVSPITLQPRFNPNATGPEPEPGQLPSQVDVRQMSLFGAGWTVGSLKYILASDTKSVTYYETTGWRGVMETEAGSPVSEKFQSFPGGVYPLYHVLADVGKFVGSEVIPTISSYPLQIEGLAVHKKGQTRVILANLSPTLQAVTVQKLSERVYIRHLNEANVEQAMQSPESFRAQSPEKQQTVNGTLKLKLLPYALVCIDEVKA